MILTPQPLQEGSQIRYNKKYAIYFQKPQEPDARQIILELPNIFTVENCMEFCIDQFNQEDPSLNLVWRPDNYRLKVAKKNGKPKDDLPGIVQLQMQALDGEQLIIDTGASVFTLIQIKQVEKQQTFAPQAAQQQPQQQQQQQEQSIKQRTSYSNSLSNNKSKKNKSEMNNSKADGNGFCFFKQCA